jgi:hypothetical protein
MLEIRLYAFGEGQRDYETIDLSKIDQPEEFARAQLFLSSQSLLGTRLSDLLQSSKQEDKDISHKLYSDYKTLRGKLIETVDVATEKKDSVAAIGIAQKILDRILFIAFAEDRELLPSKSLQKAFETKNDYDPYPVWKNFKGLFRAIDEGSEKLKISKYNGGLFKHDTTVDSLDLSDEVCEEFKRIGDYHFDTEVNVTVLGRIFEQSVSDVEKLIQRARGEVADDEKQFGVAGRRKRDGIVYTPDYIAQFIVEKTLGTHIDELFRIIVSQHAKGNLADYKSLKFKKGAEEKAWVAYRFALKNLRVVDPACGSGVFLVTAFDFLKSEYGRVDKKIAELRGKADYNIVDIEDLDREILSQNLYGVDVNAESVEITKLSLWLKTAKKGKELDSLDHNICVGDSLIEDSNFAYLKHGFSWNTAFPEVFAAGGFDVVLGNPPYVRMELIKAMKPYLENRFEVVSDRADLYCYFFERGLRLLKPNGRLGYISSSTFFKTGSGAPLRRYLLKNASIETVTDFGDLQIFEGVTTYPAILTMRRQTADIDHAILFWRPDAIPSGNFTGTFEEAAQPFQQSKLNDESWELENVTLRKLREKIVADRKSLKEVYGSPLYGIKTGLNDAFVIDQAVHDRLIHQDPTSAELLKPFLEGKDLKRWRAEPRNLWLIYIPKNTIQIDHYPAIRDHLLLFKDALEKRATKQAWFELQQAQVGYYKQFQDPKIVYGEFSGSNIFSLETNGYFLNNKCYFIPNNHKFLTLLLNSNVFRFFITAQSVAVRGDFSQLHSQYVELYPIPDEIPAMEEGIDALIETTQSMAKISLSREQSFRRRIPDLCPAGRTAKLSTKLQNWWQLSDFAAFRAEVKKCFKADIPLGERNAWEDMFKSGKAEITKLSAEIKRNEDEINAIVYKLFDLTPEEIILLETSIGAR